MFKRYNFKVRLFLQMIVYSQAGPQSPYSKLAVARLKVYIDTGSGYMTCFSSLQNGWVTAVSGLRWSVTANR